MPLLKPNFRDWCVVAQDFQVLIEAAETAGSRALVAVEEDLEGFVGGEVTLCEGGLGAAFFLLSLHADW